MTGYLTFLTQDCLRYKERTRNMALFNILDNISSGFEVLCVEVGDRRLMSSQPPIRHHRPLQLSTSTTGVQLLDPTKDLKN